MLNYVSLTQQQKAILCRQNICLVLCLFVLAMFAKSGMASEPSQICNELRKLSSTRGGLAAYAVWGIKDDRPGHEGMELIYNIDIDGDDVSEEMIWARQGSGSVVPSDLSSITIKFSKSGQEIKFEAIRFFLFRHKREIFTAASRPENINETSIYRVNQTGFDLVCPRL